MRDRYQEGVTFAQANGFKELSIQGLKPTGFRIHQTTILYRDGNCLGL